MSPADATADPRIRVASSRLLIVAAAEVYGSELREALEQRIGDGATEIRVVAPALTEKLLERTMGNVDDAIAGAERRLERALEEIRRVAESADGAVGDSDLRLAIQDALQTFDADEILIVAHQDEAYSQEHKAIAEAEKGFEPPITEIYVTEEGGEPQVAEVEEIGPGVQEVDPGEVDPSANLPPFGVRDVFGILVAIVGTGALFVLAATCEDDGFSGFDACAARLLLAGAFALVNLAHIVGLTLFQAGPYRGFWRTFFTQSSLIGTPLAVLVSALLLR